MKNNIPWNKGRTGIYSNETRSKMSDSRRGENNPNFKGWYITPTGKHPEPFTASRELGISPGSVRLRCKSEQPKFKDYCFLHRDGVIVGRPNYNYTPHATPKHRRKYGVYNSSWKGYIRTPHGVYETVREASLNLNIPHSTISWRLNNTEGWSRVI